MPRPHPVTMSLLLLLMLPLVSCGGEEPAPRGPGPAPGSPAPAAEGFPGRYRLDEDMVLEVARADGRLEVLPSFWRTAQILEPAGEDSFRSLLHPQITFRFLRDGRGRITGLRVGGHDEIGGTARRLPEGTVLPVELLLQGRPGEALDLLEEQGMDSPGRAVSMGLQLLQKFPSRAAEAVEFARALAGRFPGSAGAHELLGAALLGLGRREEAVPAFRRALEIEPGAPWAAAALRHLDPGAAPETEEAGGGWVLPFDLDGLFRPPSGAEISQVRAAWEARDLSPRGVREEIATELKTSWGVFDARVISHLVHGSRHYGAVLVPREIGTRCCPVIADIRGIGWDYPPRDISRGVRSMEILRADAMRFIYLVPGLRGEVLEINGSSFTSQGDRRDGWDGAADDVISFISAAREFLPRLRGRRTGLYGKSRGASVALLAGSRDPTVECVAAWAGPADWFSLMGTWGWTLQEQVEDGLRERWKPGQGWGSAAQFIERYLEDPIASGEPDLRQIRLRMLAASPLYFVETLPPADLHYGVEDRSVPVVNGRALARRLEDLGRDPSLWPVTFHAGAGHDMPWPAAFDASRTFLLRHLVEGEGPARRSAP